MKTATQIFQQSENLNRVENIRGLDVTFVDTSRKNRPQIRKPYEYFCQTNRKPFIKKLRDLLKPLETNKLQCSIVSAESKAFGYKLTVWALGYCPGYTGDATGISATEWNSTVETVQKEITELLGEDALLRAEPFSEQTKFELRFETYVMDKQP